MSVPRAQAFPAEGIFGVQGNLPEAKTCAWVLTLTAGRLHVPLFLSVMGFKQQLPVERHRGHTDGFVPPVGRGISAPGLRALPTISTHTGSALQRTTAPELSPKPRTRISSSATSPAWPCAVVLGRMQVTGHNGDITHPHLWAHTEPGTERDRRRAAAAKWDVWKTFPVYPGSGALSSGCCSGKRSAGPR